MTDPWQRLLGLTLLCLVVAFGVLLVMSMLTYPGEELVGAFQWRWIMANTWANLLRLAPVSQAWAVLLLFGWIEPHRVSSSQKGRNSLARFGSSIILLLVLTVLFTVTHLVWYPQAVGTKASLTHASALARNLRETATDAADERDYSRALTALSQYAVLVGQDDPALQTELRELRDQERKLLDAAPVELMQPEVSTAAGVSAAQLVERATAALDREDYSTAHYMATLALSLDPNREDATLIAAESLARLADSEMNSDESADASLFQAKLAAKQALTRGDSIDAYYRLIDLADLAPRDTDVIRYLAAAREEVAGISVFKSDIEAVLSGTGTQDLAFINENGDDGTQLIYIGKLVQTNAGVYVQRVEAITVDDSGRTLSHLTADYGKLVGDHLLLRVIDDESRDLPLEPTYLVGAPDPETDGFLRIAPNADQLSLMASTLRSPSGAPVGPLFRSLAVVEQFGLKVVNLQLELVMRLVAPFTFLVLSLFAMGFGWRYRSRRLHNPPIPTLIAIPLIPVLLIPMFHTLEYAQRIALASLLVWAGLTVALIMAVVVQTLLLLLSLGYLALSSRE